MYSSSSIAIRSFNLVNIDSEVKSSNKFKAGKLVKFPTASQNFAKVKSIALAPNSTFFPAPKNSKPRVE